MVFSEVVSTLAFLQPQSDDDAIDRLHYYYTSTSLLLFSVLISLKMFGGRPIECWMPAEYRDSWQEYTEMYCWARSTYYAPFDNSELPAIEERDRTRVSYYQWVPFYFCFVALLFYLPCLLWRVTYDKSGHRRANIQGLATHLASACKHRFKFGTYHPHHHRFLKLIFLFHYSLYRFLNLRYYEAYLSILYITIKALYLLNVCIQASLKNERGRQMYMLNRFLSPDHSNHSLYHGYKVLYDLVTGQGWSDSENFPVVTFCDLQVRILGNVQNHTVQCVLVINVFTEKVFLGLWLWFTLLLVLTTTSLFIWALDTFPLNRRVAFIVRRLELADVTFKKKKYYKEVKEMDGIFTLRMLTMHSNVLVCTEVVDLMWDQFLKEKSEADKMEDQRDVRLGCSSPSRRLRKISAFQPLVSHEDIPKSHNDTLELYHAGHVDPTLISSI